MDLVHGPNLPEEGDDRGKPLSAWKLRNAAFVSGPNMVVSFPGEPAPLWAIMYPWVFKKIWRFFIWIDAAERGVTAGAGIGVEFGAPVSQSFNDALVKGPTWPAGAHPCAA